MLKWVVGNRNRDYRTKDLLRETGMLSVNQMITMKIIKRGLVGCHRKKETSQHF